MSVFLTVLSVIGAVLGGIAALVIIVFLALLPVKAEVDIGYNNEDKFLLRVKYFLFSFTVFPKKQKKKEDEKPKEEENSATDDNKTDTDEKKLQQSGASTEEKDSDAEKNSDDTENDDNKTEKNNDSFFMRKAKLMDISDYITLLGYVKDMLGKIRFGDLCVNLVFGSDDASKTAMVYGTATAAIFPLIGRIYNEKKAKYIDAHINADFASETTYADVYAEVYIRTVYAVALAAKVLIYLLKIKENDNGRK